MKTHTKQCTHSEQWRLKPQNIAHVAVPARRLYIVVLVGIVALLVFGALGLRLFFNGREEWNVALVAAGTVLGSAIAVIAARQRAEVSFCLPLHYTRILLTF